MQLGSVYLESGMYANGNGERGMNVCASQTSFCVHGESSSVIPGM